MQPSTRWERIAWIVATIVSILLGSQLPPIFPPGSPPPIIIPPGSPAPPIPIPLPPVPDQPTATPDPINAILKLRLGNSGCTAVTIGGLKDITGVCAVTAAHCVSSVGQQGTVTTKNGKSYSCSVVRIDRRTDCALLAIKTSDVLPFAKIASTLPAAGVKVWHAGYGVDRPGNTEHGEVVVGENRDGQTQFRLNVSSGDSGGPIYNAANGEVLSVVCCGARLDVWGASCTSIQRLIGAQSWGIED